MIKFFVLLPIIMFTVWWWYLKDRGYTLKEGAKGFMVIFAFNFVVIGFFVLMLFLTR